ALLSVASPAENDALYVREIYTPGPRSTVEEVATGQGVVYASIFDNVTGSVVAYRFKNGAWSGDKLDLPANGSTHIVSTNDFGPEVLLTFDSYLRPTTLYLGNGGNKPAPIKSLPERF